MSRKRKPNRKRQGGRVTPPKQAQGTSGSAAVPPDLDLWADAAGHGERWTDPGKLGDGGSDLEPDVHSVFAAMAEAMELSLIHIFGDP